MAYFVEFSNRAIVERLKLLEDIEIRFGVKKAEEVNQKIDKVIDQIVELPLMYPASKSHQGLRKCIFSKQTSIYYRLHDNRLEIIAFRPNRVDPKSFKA